MSRRREAGGVLEGGVVHAQLTGPRVHALHEGLLAAGDLLAQSHGAVVGGDDAHGLEHIAHGHLLVFLEPDLGAAHGAGVGGGGHHGVVGELAGVDGLHGQEDGHDLGDAGGLQLGVFVLGKEDGAGLLFHQEGGGRGHVQGADAGGQGQHGAQRREQFFHGGSPFVLHGTSL